MFLTPLSQCPGEGWIFQIDRGHPGDAKIHWGPMMQKNAWVLAADNLSFSWGTMKIFVRMRRSHLMAWNSVFLSEIKKSHYQNRDFLFESPHPGAKWLPPPPPPPRWKFVNKGIGAAGEKFHRKLVFKIFFAGWGVVKLKKIPGWFLYMKFSPWFTIYQKFTGVDPGGPPLAGFSPGSSSK